SSSTTAPTSPCSRRPTTSMLARRTCRSRPRGGSGWGWGSRRTRLPSSTRARPTTWRSAAGLDYVAYAARHARRPWFAIGGIDETNVGEVVAAGAQRVAVVRAITEAADPERAAAELRAALPWETPGVGL